MTAINEKQLSDLLGDDKAVNLAYMTLAAIPVGDEVTTRYGKITRNSDTDYKITINNSYTKDRFNNYSNRVDSKDSISELFTK